MKKNIVIGILLLFLGAASVGVGLSLWLYEAPQTNKKFVKDFKSTIRKGMEFVPLDYMSEGQIESCNNLYEILKSNYKKIDLVVRKELDGPVSKDIFCNQIGEDGLPDMYHFDIIPEHYYVLNNGYVFVTYINDMINLKFLDKKTCEMSSNKNMLASDNYVIIEIDDRYYVISEWFDKDRFVFYYVDASPEYDEVNCRFNSIN